MRIIELFINTIFSVISVDMIIKIHLESESGSVSYLKTYVLWLESGKMRLQEIIMNILSTTNMFQVLFIWRIIKYILLLVIMYITNSFYRIVVIL